MTKLAINTEWTWDHIPINRREQYADEYLYLYRTASDYLSPFLEDLNKKFVKEVGEMENYDNPTYNNWMAVQLTSLLTKSGLIDSDIFRFVFYDSEVVLNCVTWEGGSVRMGLIPGSEKFLEE